MFISYTSDRMVDNVIENIRLGNWVPAGTHVNKKIGGQN